MAADTVKNAETRAYNRGVRAGRDEMKNSILRDLNTIPWIGNGKARLGDLTEYITKKYMKLK